MIIYNSSIPITLERNQGLHSNNTSQPQQNASVSNNTNKYSTHYNPNASVQGNTAIAYSEADILTNYKNRTSATNDAQTKDATSDRLDNKEEQLKKPEVKAALQELRLTEQNVRAHEQAHKAAGAGVTGAISYSYTTGPDGKRYISGGEVSVGTSGGSTPEETLKQLEQVKRAALAPADPSPQDLSVAASTSAQMLQVRGEIASEASEEFNKDTSAQEDIAVSDVESTINTQVAQSTENPLGPEPTSDKANAVRPSESDDKQQRVQQDIEKTMIERAYNQATSTYKLHMNMAEMGMVQQPMFSQIA